jgi:tRNA(His) 5'-end guanylyltransferase
MKKDELGTRMKDYEIRSRTYLPRRANTIIRLDGKAFHTYTRGLDKPFDYQLMDDMIEVTKFLCKEIQGCKIGYTQSDEISLVLTDYDNIRTSAWYDGQVQKICSVSASLATAKFNELRPGKLAFFDSRCYSISDQQEVVNYLLWRQQDASRNSVSMAAQSVYSHKELHKKSTMVQQEMLFQKGINWNDYSISTKRGSSVIKTYYEKDGGQRSKWEYVDIPILSKDRDFVLDLLPELS